jgi:hypothetical protein
MIPRAHKFALAAALFLLPLVSYAAPSKATNQTNATSQATVRSTFITPQNPLDGRDPFFPNATSLYPSATTTVTRPVQETGVNLLKLKSVLGTSLAQINNVTLAVGETEEIKTDSGPVSVKLIEIRPDNSVAILVNGQRHVLNFGAK